jgi:hypothetical protein
MNVDSYYVPKDNFYSNEAQAPLKDKIEQFGEKWIKPRESCLLLTLQSLIFTIHWLVIALFNSTLAICNMLKDQQFNDKSVKAWKGFGMMLAVSGSSFIGIFSPTASEKINQIIQKNFFN